ncbi:cytochrome P450 [Gigaspora rosea]|uniref:Cytochrome P450 n=1 Tax=Gigaspora rosea TaxID=44941 RepID=A0A397W6R4_9GLOM|nr:cytochrome P450 [Gigaspora rosea]
MITQKIIDFFGITDYFILFFLTLTTYIFTFYYNYLIRPNPLPGPLPLPFIGNLYNFVYGLKSFYEQCQRKYGDICEIMINGHRCIVISQPKYMEKFFSHSSYSGRLLYSQGVEEIGFYGRGITLNEGYKSWNYHRQFFTYALLAPRFMDTTINFTNKLYKEMSGYWQSLGKQNTLSNNYDNKNWILETDFHGWFHCFANDLISIVTTGERTYTIASYYNTQSTIKSEHPDALVEDGYKFVNANVNFIKDIIFFIFDEIIKNRRKKIEEMPLDKDMNSDMLTLLITANTTKSIAKVKALDGKMLKPMSDEEIRINLLEAILGGTDTTSNLFCLITYYLCKYPHVKQKMILEIDSIFPKSSEKFNVSRNDISKLKYCKAIIKETNRIIPVAMFTPRCTVGECEFAGYKWPTSTHFHLNIIGANNHPKFWSNPEIFDPDRFYDDNKYDQKFVDKNFIMFGGGHRVCPGRKLAMTEILLLMALVFKSYNVELVDINKPLKFDVGAVASCQELKVRISPRI